MNKDEMVNLFKKIDDKNKLIQFGQEIIDKEISVIQYKIIDDDFVISIYDNNNNFSVYRFCDNEQPYFLEKEKINNIEQNTISLSNCYDKYINGIGVNNLMRFGAFLKINDYDIISNILKKIDISI